MDRGKQRKEWAASGVMRCACAKGGVELTRGAHLVAAVDDCSTPYHGPLDCWMGRLKIIGRSNLGGGGHNHGENLRDEWD